MYEYFFRFASRSYLHAVDLQTGWRDYVVSSTMNIFIALARPFASPSINGT